MGLDLKWLVPVGQIIPYGLASPSHDLILPGIGQFPEGKLLDVGHLMRQGGQRWSPSRMLVQIDQELTGMYALAQSMALSIYTGFLHARLESDGEAYLG